MEKIKLVIYHPIFVCHYTKIAELESERIFCRHDIQHALDVSRIAWIKVLNGRLTYSKEVIYAIGLLHDIGRALQYMNGVPHAISGADISRKILCDCGFSDKDINLICEKILNHQVNSSDQLGKIIFQADKESRLCWCCKARSECKWTQFNDLLLN